jgi:hypothetical protein
MGDSPCIGRNRGEADQVLVLSWASHVKARSSHRQGAIVGPPACTSMYSPMQLSIQPHVAYVIFGEKDWNQIRLREGIGM